MCLAIVIFFVYFFCFASETFEFPKIYQPARGKKTTMKRRKIHADILKTVSDGQSVTQW
jgi:hypothetical protein